MKTRCAVSCFACGHLQMVAPSIGMQTAPYMYHKCAKCFTPMKLSISDGAMTSEPEEGADHVLALEGKYL